MKWLLWAGAAGAVAYILFPTQVAMLVGGVLQKAQSLGPAPVPTGHPYTIPGLVPSVPASGGQGLILGHNADGSPIFAMGV